MGNICIHKQEDQRAKIIKIIGYPRLSCPNKLILVPSIQNLTQNLDTFEEDFYKSEFILDFQPDIDRNQSTRKVKLGSTIEEINRLNLIQCPSLCHIDDNYEIHQNHQQQQMSKHHQNNNDVILRGQKHNQLKKRNKKVSLQKFEQPKSILKSHAKLQIPSYNSFYKNKSSRTVTFSFASSKSRNSRSLSPMINALRVEKQPDVSRSMSQLLQFPYL
ncbi:unnamed protein product (macronuclear) [Paramecium tetraurelia]|uniref:Uncharacterized protein n=1 Tax=Paramecium tetraurelia TaxID=5888 RepID=A0BJ57_PARTE|nr:uncharacterized protein GSPATT00004947001 [Paramecium tetraurelia]CAK58574.1 unnamed protein product [Paramecium tetraurelia]|eukprot:XP_001425972.1 hypothetical protein (macronuclear) [Paramecium tetraurelia strain d4-2]